MNWKFMSSTFFSTCLLAVPAAAMGEILRTSAGHPDLTGTYDSGTLTPEERPQVFGDRQFMTRQEADQLLKSHPFTQSDANVISDPNRGAPQAGGDGRRRTETTRQASEAPQGRCSAEQRSCGPRRSWRAGAARRLGKTGYAKRLQAARMRRRRRGRPWEGHWATTRPTRASILP